MTSGKAPPGAAAGTRIVTRSRGLSLLDGGSPAGAVTKSSIRAEAVRFAKRWAGAESERAEAQTFWNEFFKIFGIDRRLVGQYEQHAERVSTGGRGAIDLFVPQKLAVEHKSAGKDLVAAMAQLLDYLPSVPDGEAPRMAVACDFAHFMFNDFEIRTKGSFALSELPDNIERFWWLAGHDQQAEAASVEELNLAATMLMRDLHDELKRARCADHPRRVWLTRVLFCVFADSTAVWDRGLFASYVAQSREDGSDLGGNLAALFQVLNEPARQRSPALDAHLAAFAYINGDLFAERIPIAHCTAEARKALLEVCRFNWSAISPAIFGSLFQEVMKPSERREIGAHYTSEENIMRVIRPLFLDDLEKELARADSVPKLEAFHDKLASLTFFDPAAGCGNFLVVAYRELRRLETETLKAVSRKRSSLRGAARQTTGQQVFDLNMVLKVSVSQFYGIEIEEFPARIASTALYLADHIANREASAEFGQYYIRFPIQSSPHIHIANALGHRLEQSARLAASRLCVRQPSVRGVQAAVASPTRRHGTGPAERHLEPDRLCAGLVCESARLHECAHPLRFRIDKLDHARRASVRSLCPARRERGDDPVRAPHVRVDKRS